MCLPRCHPQKKKLQGIEPTTFRMLSWRAAIEPRAHKDTSGSEKALCFHHLSRTFVQLRPFGAGEPLHPNFSYKSYSFCTYAKNGPLKQEGVFFSGLRPQNKKGVTEK